MAEVTDYKAQFLEFTRTAEAHLTVCAGLTFEDLQDLTERRALALLQVTFLPGATDKRRSRELRVRLASRRPFTPRRVRDAASLAWRYRRQIDASLVPAAPVTMS